LYSFMLRATDGFQESNVHTGIKNVVKIIINNAIPSIPKITLLFDKTSQSILSKNWNPDTVGSKKNSNIIEILKINRDQKREKFLINLTFVFSVTERTNTPTSGKAVRQDNIKINKISTGFLKNVAEKHGWSNCP
jgi:hypothetical protein